MADVGETAVIALFDGDAALLRPFLARAAHATVLVLSPEDDEARRIVHEARFDGVPVFTLEHPRRPRRSQFYGELAASAAHLLAAAWIVPLRLDETFAAAEDPAQRGGLRGEALRALVTEDPLEAAGDLRAVIRTVTLPGPAHKEVQAVRLRTGCARSVLLPLHAPPGSREVRIEIAGLGPAILDADALRLFRSGTLPRSVPLAEAPNWLRVAGHAAQAAAALRAPLPTGAVVLNVDLEMLEAQTGAAWDALEIRIRARAVHADQLLTTDALGVMSAEFRDPWSVTDELAALAASQRV